jgi:hypothetical protein
VNGAPGLAAWLGAATDATTGVTVPAGVWADLVRAGVPVGRLVPDGALAVSRGTPGAGRVLARFGEGPSALHVTGRAAAPVAPPALAGSATAGTRLASNPNLTAPEHVRALLQAGAVDPRAVAVLVGLAGRGPVVVVDLPVVPGEDPAQPRHRVILDDVDAAADEWLTAQAGRYAPIMSSAGTDVGTGTDTKTETDAETDAEADTGDPAEQGVATTLTWPVPAPDG